MALTKIRENKSFEKRRVRLKVQKRRVHPFASNKNVQRRARRSIFKIWKTRNGAIFLKTVNDEEEKLNFQLEEIRRLYNKRYF
jgi:hypothetical protein